MKDVDSNVLVDNVKEQEIKDGKNANILFEYNGEKPSDEEVGFVKKILGFSNETDEYAARMADTYLDPDGEIGMIMGTLGFSKAPYREFGPFFAYIMGEKDKSLEEAIEIVDDEGKLKEYAEDFRTFVKSHKPEGENAAENVKAWIDFFKKGDEKFAQYRFPEADYEKKEDMSKWKHTLDWIKTVHINITQEFEGLAGSEYGQVYIPNKESKVEALETWFGFNGIISDYDSAYSSININTLLSLDSKEKRKDMLGQSAAKRVKFQSEATETFSGKTAAEVARKDSKRSLYEMLTIGSSVKYNLKDGEAVDYLTGKNDRAVPELKKRYDEVLSQARMSYNSLVHQQFCRFKRKLLDDVGKSDKRDKIIGFFAQSENPQELNELLKSDDMTAFRTYINDTFNFFTGSSYIADTTKLMNKKPLELIKIDGKNPYEIWGDKYSAVTDLKDKEMLIKAEIMKEVHLGEKEVSIDTFVLDEKDEFKQIKPYLVSKNKDTLLKEAAFFKSVNFVHEKLCGLRERLKATQDDPKAIFDDVNKETGSRSYRKMAKALAKCIAYSDFTSRWASGDYNQLEEALKELRVASDDYYRSHTGIHGITSGWRDNGKERISVSEEMKNDLGYVIESLKDMAYGTDIKRNNNYIDDFADFKMGRKWNDLKIEAHNRNLDFSDSDLKAPVWNLVIDNMQLASRKDTLRKQIMRMTAVPTKEENMDVYIGGIFTGGPYECAKQYYKRQYLNNIRKAGTSEYIIGIEDIEQDMNSDDFEKRFFDKVNRLAENPEFAKLVSSNEKNWMAKWSAKEKAKEKALFDELAENNDTYKQLIWNDEKNVKEMWKAAEYRLEIWNNEWNREKEFLNRIKKEIHKPDSPFNVPEDSVFYMENTSEAIQRREAWREEREYLAKALSRVLALSIARDQAADYSLMEMALEPKQMKEVQGYIEKGLKEDLFSVKNNSAKMIERINNFDHLKETAKQYVKNGVDAKKAAAAGKKAAKVKVKEVQGPKIS